MKTPQLCNYRTKMSARPCAFQMAIFWDFFHHFIHLISRPLADTGPISPPSFRPSRHLVLAGGKVQHIVRHSCMYAHLNHNPNTPERPFPPSSPSVWLPFCTSSQLLQQLKVDSLPSLLLIQRANFHIITLSPSLFLLKMLLLHLPLAPLQLPLRPHLSHLPSPDVSFMTSSVIISGAIWHAALQMRSVCPHDADGWRTIC